MRSGRVYSSRIAGSRLVFFDLVQDGHRVQVLCNSRKIDSLGAPSEEFKQFYHILRRGDIFCELDSRNPIEVCC
jgi:lysyl-tRNA synthetase class 2